MSSNNDNRGGNSGVQQPKRKRKNHKDHCQWSRHQWENILKTNMDAAPSHGTLITSQAQQEPQKVQGSHSCDSSLCLSTKLDNPHSNVSSAIGAGITYQAEKESAEGSHDCSLSLGFPVEVGISHSIVSSAAFDSALSNQESAKAGASLLAGVFPANPSIGNIEMPAAIGPAKQAPRFSSKYDSQFSSLQSSLRNAAETPSTFRKRKGEQFSERKNREADTYVEKLHSGAGYSGGDPELNSASLFPLEPDLQTLKGNSVSVHGSPSCVGLRSESDLLPVDNHGLLLLLAGCEDEGWLQKNNALSSVSSEVPSLAFTDSVHHQPSKMPHAASLKGKGQLLDSDRNSIHSDFRSAFMEKMVDISAFETLNELGSATPSSGVTPSKRGSPSTHVTPSREASKVSPSTLATSSRARSKKVRPSTSATPPREASKKVSQSARGISSMAGPKKVSPSTSATPPREASKEVLQSARATSSRAGSKKVSPSTSATPPREASKKVSQSTRATSSRAGSKKVSPSTTATPPRAVSRKVSPSSNATPSRAASQNCSPSTCVTRSGHITRPALGTLSQQKRSSSRNNRLTSQIEGPSTHSELPFNQNEGLSNEDNQPSDQMRRHSNPSTVPSNQDRRPSVSSGRVKSSFKGVSMFKRTGRFEAHFWNTAERRQEYLGSFSTEEQAARAYDRATLFFRGVNAKLHFQLEDYAGELPLLVALSKDQLLSMLKEQGHKEGSRYPTYPS